MVYKSHSQLSLDCINQVGHNVPIALGENKMPPVDRNNPKRAESSESQYTLLEFMQEFPDDATCLEWLWRNRYSEDGEHAYCEKCEQERIFERYDTTQHRQSWTCTGCGNHLHPTAGTIFEKSSTSLHLWFYAMYLITSTRCGISAKQLERELGVTYKTAWRIFNKIRSELMSQDNEPQLGAKAPVEVDETYVGGKPRYRSPMSKKGRGTRKTCVIGAVERGGRVFAKKIDSIQIGTMTGFITEKVLPKSEVFTDELPSYNDVSDHGYRHRRIRHSERVYVMGDVHTNTIEGFWSLVKRGIGGVYHSVSAKYLDSYLSEYVWRYNQRLTGEAYFRLLLLRSAKP
jgi:transposase-like protein